jgi:phage terminase small subunit
MGKRLKPMQRTFALEYAVHGNATKAAIAAGYSPRSAHAQAHKLLKKAEIQEALIKREQRVIAKSDLKAIDVLNEIRKLAFAQVEGAYDEKGNLLPLTEMSDEVRSALVSVESRSGGVKKIRLADKVKSLEMLAKHFKLLTEIHEHDVTAKVAVVNPEEVKAEIERLEKEF